MLSIIDPNLQAQYIDKCNPDQVHFEIVKHLLMMSDEHVLDSSGLDKRAKGWMKDTLKSLFSKEDFLDGHTLEFIYKVMRLVVNELNSLAEHEEERKSFVKSLKKDIVDRTVLKLAAS